MSINETRLDNMIVSGKPVKFYIWRGGTLLARAEGKLRAGTHGYTLLDPKEDDFVFNFSASEVQPNFSNMSIHMRVYPIPRQGGKEQMVGWKNPYEEDVNHYVQYLPGSRYQNSNGQVVLSITEMKVVADSVSITFNYRGGLHTRPLKFFKDFVSILDLERLPVRWD